MKPEPLSVIVLTKDESANLAGCLDAVLAQLEPEDEAIVVDSASTDGTLDLAARYAELHPGRVRVHAFPVNVSFGAARNAGVLMARHDVLVFLSADALPERGWLDELRGAIARADVVYGRQRHAPTRHNAVTVSRGLRYHRFESSRAGLPERFASNVNAAYRRTALERIRFDEELEGAEDVAFAKAARLDGLRLSYASAALVRHKDVASWGGEWRKHVREGKALARLRGFLPAPSAHLAWAVAVAGLALIAIASGNPIVLAGTGLVFFAPTLRRLASPLARRYKPHALLAGAIVSPLFDLAFVGAYLAALGRRMLARKVRKGVSA